MPQVQPSANVFIEEARRVQAQQQAELEALRNTDIADWAEENFYITQTGAPIVLYPHQKAVLRYAFRRRDSKLPFSTVVLSTIKKSGKSTLGALVGRWAGETQTRFGEIPTVGNDARQAQERSFKFVRESIELNPEYVRQGINGTLPGRWAVQQTKLTCLTTRTKLEPIAVDARGESGGSPDFSIWTEAWGIELQENVRFWEEMTEILTKPESVRVVESYAGYEGESPVLRQLYDLGMEGRQLTAGEVAAATDTPLGAFEEAPNPDSLVPMWVNSSAGLFMYWDSGLAARRMPWQKGARAEKYYREQEVKLPPNAFSRMHKNLWVGVESEFVPIELWNACFDPDLPVFIPGESKEPCILAVDAATTGDCFAIVAVTRHPNRHDEAAIRAVKVWYPPKGGTINYSEPEKFINWVRGSYNLICLVADPHQMEDMCQRLERDGLWCERFSQGLLRLKADKRLYDLIINHKLAHNGDSELREHIRNASAKHQKDQDSTLRIVKRSANKKIDAAVAASMGVWQCLYLLL